MSARKKCTRWCDLAEKGPHAGRCVHFHGEVLLSAPGDAYCISVTLEGRGKHPSPYLAVAQGHGSLPYALAAMSWAEADALADLLASARRRYA